MATLDISVIWRNGKENRVAFQVRSKKYNINAINGDKDQRKLHSIDAVEKYLVNVSEQSGLIVLCKVNDRESDLSSRQTTAQTSQKFGIGIEKAYTVERIRLKFPRAYEKWTDQEDAQLTSGHNRKLTIGQLADEHQRKKGAIRARLKKLGLIKMPDSLPGYQDKRTYDYDLVKSKYARSYDNWSDEEVKQLISEYHQKLTIREIAEKHQRRRSEIRVRLERLRLFDYR